VAGTARFLRLEIEGFIWHGALRFTCEQDEMVGWVNFSRSRPMQPEIKLRHSGPGKDTLTYIPGTWAHGVIATMFGSRLPRSLRPARRDDGLWFNPQSPFSAAVNAKDYSIYLVEWPEYNSVKDRRKAAACLAAHLVDRVGEGGRHFVVAHSHGGNVATMAFAHPELTAYLPHVHFASMGSPFIWVRKRGLPAGVALSAKPISALLVLLALYFVLSAVFRPLALIPYDFPREPSVLPLWAWGMIVLGGVGILGLVALGLSVWALKVAWRSWSAIPTALELAEKETSPDLLAALGSFLILQSVADEAWLTLSQAAFGLWINGFARWLIAKTTVITQFCISAFIWVALPIAVVAMAARPLLLGGRFEYFGRLAAVLALLVTICLFMLMCLQGIAFAIVGLLGGLLLCSFGFRFFEGFGLFLGAETHIEHYPSGGPWSIFCADRIEGLRHAVHESNEARNEIAKWMRNANP